MPFPRSMRTPVLGAAAVLVVAALLLIVAPRAEGRAAAPTPDATTERTVR